MDMKFIENYNRRGILVHETNKPHIFLLDTRWRIRTSALCSIEARQAARVFIARLNNKIVLEGLA